MNNETYVSLYNYKGQPTRISGIGKQVYAAAKAKGINIVYEQLPEHKQTKEYPSVATYPMSFLDEYFEVKPKTELELLTERVTMLETQVALLLKLPESAAELVEDDDDLPF
jgi:hypothetical protein